VAYEAFVLAYRNELDQMGVLVVWEEAPSD